MKRRELLARMMAAGTPQPIIDAGGQHNAIRQNTSLLTGVQRAFGETGEWGLERISESVDISVSPYDIPSWQYFLGRRLLGSQTGWAAVAAQRGMFGILNPTGSKTIAEVYLAGADPAAADAWMVGWANSNVLSAGATVNVLTRDSHLPPSIGIAICQAWLLQAAGPPGGLDFHREMVPAAVMTSQAPIFSLLPGNMVYIYDVTVNRGGHVVARWFERAALPGELSA